MDNPFSFRIPWIRMVNRWIVVIYFSLIHPILLYRRFYNGGMTVATYFWIAMAVLVLILYLPQVVRDTRQAIRLEFDGLVITIIYLFRRSIILPIQEVVDIQETSKEVLILTQDTTYSVSEQVPKEAVTLLRQLHERYREN